MILQMIAAFTCWAVFFLLAVLGYESKAQTLAPVHNLVLKSDAFDSEADWLEELLHPSAYVYQQQTMDRVNWLYIGFVPRAQNASQVRVHFSKQSFLMRAHMKLSREDVARYPLDLIQRRSEVVQHTAAHRVRFFQDFRFANWVDQIDRIEEELPRHASVEVRYAYGLQLLKQFFPGNIFLSRDSHFPVEMQLVYPITIHEDGNGWPRDGVYTTQTLDERRSVYYAGTCRLPGGCQVRSHIFNGYPAFWFDLRGAGTGVHGPIRFIEPDERRNRRQRAPFGNHPDEIDRFFSENNYLNEPIDPRTGLELRYRFEVVRTNDSKGCFRALTMELRHLLPANPVELKRVIFDITSERDQIDLNDGRGPRAVDIDYYVTDPYRFAMSREEWYRSHLLTAQERARNPEGVLMDLLNNAKVFPLLDPATLEFRAPNGGGAPTLMRDLNRM